MTTDTGTAVTVPASEAMPYNATTGQPYRGGNITRLLAAQIENDYNGGHWAGFHQWRAVGRTVRKGEHGTHCLTVVTGKDEKKRARGFVVFHRDQTEPLPEPVE